VNPCDLDPIVVSFGSEQWQVLCGCDARIPERPVADRTTAMQAYRAHCGGPFNPATGEPYTKAEGYAIVDARSKGRCEHPEHHERCDRWGTEHHHIAGRVGADPHNPGNILLLSLFCHRHTHAEPARSRELGTMGSRLGKVRP